MSRVIDVGKYPFLFDLNEILSIKYPGLRIEDILKNPDSYPFTRSIEILESIVSKGTVYSRDFLQEDEVLAFNSLLIGAIALGDRSLVNKIALAYSKNTSISLMREPVENLVSIARKLGLDVEVHSDPPRIITGLKSRTTIMYIAKPLSIDFKQYLNIVSKRLAHDPKYMLVNQIVSSGRVFVDKETLVRLIEEVVYRKIIEYTSKLEINSSEITLYLSKYREVLERNNWFKKKEVSVEAETTSVQDEYKYYPEHFPPCIKNVISKIESSGNPSHHERFALAAFLTHIGLDTDTILEFFKKTADFNEKIARYQIEHISGLRGSRKKYLPYNCDNMKSLGICPLNTYCDGGKNPLAVYKYNVRVRTRKKRAREVTESGDNVGETNNAS